MGSGISRAKNGQASESPRHFNQFVVQVQDVSTVQKKFKLIEIKLLEIDSEKNKLQEQIQRIFDSGPASLQYDGLHPKYPLTEMQVRELSCIEKQINRLDKRLANISVEVDKLQKKILASAS